jgi:hypothetical protein
MTRRIPLRICPFALLVLLGCDEKRRGEWDGDPLGFGFQATKKTPPAQETAPLYPQPDYSGVTNPNHQNRTRPSTPRARAHPPQQQRPEAWPNTPPQPTTWTTFRDPRNRYEASFPTGLMRETLLNQTIQGKNYRTFVNGIQDGDRAYVVLVTENVPEPRTREEIDALDLEFMKLAVSGARGKGGQYSKTLTGRDGIPAGVLEFQNEARTCWGKCHGFILNDVAYQLVAIDAVGNRQAVERFLNDFQLLAGDGNARPQPKIEFTPPVPTPSEGPPAKPRLGSGPSEAVTTPTVPSPRGVAPAETPETPPSKPAPLKPADRNFPSMHAPTPEQKLIDPPADVPQPEFPKLPTIPKVKGK